MSTFQRPRTCSNGGGIQPPVVRCDLHALSFQVCAFGQHHLTCSPSLLTKTYVSNFCQLVYGWQKRIRSTKPSTSGHHLNISTSGAGETGEPEVFVENSVNEDIAILEVRVAEFLTDIQKDINMASAFMLEGIMTAFSRTSENIRSKIPDLQKIRVMNQRLELNVSAIRNLD
jgi:hypothetical protein